MKEKIGRFMAGRYGNDKLNQFMMAVFLGCAVLNLFVRNAYVSTVLNSWECLLILLVYIRMFSRNISKRYAENQKFIRGRITLIGCPEAGRRRLYRETDGHHQSKRYPQRHHRADGSALLRWTRDGSQESIAGERQIPPMAGGYNLY